MTPPESNALTDAVRALRDAGAKRVTVSPEGDVVGEFSREFIDPRFRGLGMLVPPPAASPWNDELVCELATPDWIADHDRSYGTREPD